MPPFLKEHAEGTLLLVKVQPRASSSGIGEALGGELKIKVTAPPVDSAANEAVIDLLGRILKRPRSSIVLLRGETSRHKAVLLRGLAPETVAAALRA